MANADVFDIYFRQADSDKDGRISGAEAVAFFKGANLPQPILYKIWQYSDQRKSGFLSRAEFYNALKLITVAQSGRELTPEIIQASFSGPASSQIPAPRIASGPSSAFPTSNTVLLQATMTKNAAVHQPPPPGLTSPYPFTLPEQTARPAFSLLGSNSPGFEQNLPTASLGVQSWAPSRSPSLSLQSELKGLTSLSVQPKMNPIQASSAGSGTKGSVDESLIDFSTEVVSASVLESSTQATPGPPGGKIPEPMTTSAGPSPGISTSLVAPKPPLTTAISRDPAVQEFRAPSSSVDAAGSWPKMTQNDVERYSRIFFQVDTDRDGKISGIQARDLFLSWRLPREVLKQIWDLSDQDGDTMLSLREFFTALYLMERHREGRQLPSVLPAGIHLEENGQLLSSNASQVAGIQPQIPQYSANSLVPSQQRSGSMASSQIPAQAQTLNGVEAESNDQTTYKSKAPTLDMDLVKQLSKEEQENLKSKQQDAEESDKKVYELEKDIMHSQNQIDTYRTKLQELILLKSRGDNRLAEVIEQSAAEKREIETLARKYDAKFRQAGEVNSRLQAEEAMFRDIQEKKMELYNAIAQIGQRDISSSLPQAHVDRLVADLSELKKILTTRAKQLGIRLRSHLASEATVGIGGQLEIQDSFVDWDDDWDKFDDEGFTSLQEPIKDIFTDSEAVEMTTSKPVFGWDEESLFDDKFDISSESQFQNKVEAESDETLAQHLTAAVFDSPKAESEAGSQISSIESPQHDIFSPRRSHFGKSKVADPLINKPKSRYDRGAESQDFDTGNESFWPPNKSMFNSDVDDADKLSSWESEFGGNKYEVESDIGDPWTLRSTTPHIQTATGDGSRNSNIQTGVPQFDSHSFIDSLDSGNLRVSTSTDAAKHENDFFGTTNAKSWRDPFEASMPGTPLFKAESPVTTSSLLGDEFNAKPHNFSQFDSISSRSGSRLRGLGSFDEADPFAGTGPFGLTSQSSRSSEHWGAF